MLQVVDISQETQAAADKLLAAAHTQGFVYLTGHGYTQNEVDSLFGLAQECFEMSGAAKAAYSLRSSEENVGYSGFHSEVLDPEQQDQQRGDPKEAFNFGKLNFETGFPSQRLPNEVFGSNSHNVELLAHNTKKLYAICMRVMRLLALGLKIENEFGGKDWFVSRFRPSGPSGSALRFLHYPAPSNMDSDLDIRAGAHTDYGAITLLFQLPGQEGLEIYSGGRWQGVEYVGSENGEGAAPIVMNIGDQLSYWTGGILKSTLHRVRLPSDRLGDRYSIVFFSHPEESTLLQPIPSEMVRHSARGANLGQVLTAKQHLDRKLARAYGWSQ